MFVDACFGQIRFRICFVSLDMLSIVLFVLGMSTATLLWKPGDGPYTHPSIRVRWKLETAEPPRNYNSIITNF